MGLDVAMHPTGLEEKVEEFEKTVRLQERQSEKVKILGIVGMGGSGKTTLAKYLFNKKSSNFGKSCFLFDVRENAARRSLNSLQEKLIKDLVDRREQIDHEDVGKEMLRKLDLKGSQHVLVVIDDVDHATQLDAFLPIKKVLRKLPSDSLILVTSRDKDVLKASGIAESSIYKLTGLNEQYSQQLFCLHAFCQPHPPSVFKNLVHEFCTACDGLPLSLTVFGRLLRDKRDKSYWKGLLDKLRRTNLPNDIRKRLKLSYDALEREEKQIFLDIACYFIGENMDMAIRIWEGSGWSGLAGLQNLQAKCLVEVDGENTLKMHDHLRDMGREIADEVIPRRLWRLIEDIPHLCQRSSVIIEVRGIRTVPRFSEFRESQEAEMYGKRQRKRKLNDPARCLENARGRGRCFSNLQLVATEDGHLESILRRVEWPNLIWLRWNDCPYTYLPSWITMKNTRVLEVSGKKLETLWRSESQAPLELRELTISSPRFLKFPKSIGQLEHIEKIVVKASHLKSLPEEFCQLGLLKYLDLSQSSLLQMLPKSFGSLENLRHLDLSGSRSLQMLPDTFGKLIHLKHLNLCGCSSLTLSGEPFAYITTLEYLDLEDCSNVGALPPEVAHQPSLERLRLGGTGLKELPEDIGNLSNLEWLALGGPLETLPSSLGRLSNLKMLRIENCSELKSLPDSLGELTQLSRLEIDTCEIKSLPDWLGRFTQLSTLRISACPIESLPAEVVKLNNLRILSVEECPLRELPLKKVVEGETAVIELSRLEYLDLSVTKVSEISFIEGVCPTLKHLGMTGCDDLVEVGALPPTLTVLSIFGCDQLRKMEGLWNLTNLQELNIRDCREVEELPGLERLISLEVFRADGCSKLKRIGGLEAIAGVEDLRSLKILNIARCPKLQWDKGVLKKLRQRGVLVK